MEGLKKDHSEYLHWDDIIDSLLLPATGNIPK